MCSLNALGTLVILQMLGFWGWIMLVGFLVYGLNVHSLLVPASCIDDAKHLILSWVLINCSATLNYGANQYSWWFGKPKRESVITAINP